MGTHELGRGDEQARGDLRRERLARGQVAAACGHDGVQRVCARRGAVQDAQHRPRGLSAVADAPRAAGLGHGRVQGDVSGRDAPPGALARREPRAVHGQGLRGRPVAHRAPDAGRPRRGVRHRRLGARVHQIPVPDGLVRHWIRVPQERALVPPLCDRQTRPRAHRPHHLVRSPGRWRGHRG